VDFIVCRAVGLEYSANSSDYIQRYATDDEVQLESRKHVQKTESPIISERDIDPQTTDERQALHSDQGLAAQDHAGL
jgi:hypothetical protein